MRLRPRLLENGGVDSKMALPQNVEYFATHSLRIIRGMEYLVEVGSSPAQFAAQLQ
jgi:hypothetical protein